MSVKSKEVVKFSLERSTKKVAMINNGIYNLSLNIKVLLIEYKHQYFSALLNQNCPGQCNTASSISCLCYQHLTLKLLLNVSKEICQRQLCMRQITDTENKRNERMKEKENIWKREDLRRTSLTVARLQYQEVKDKNLTKCVEWS